MLRLPPPRALAPRRRCAALQSHPACPSPVQPRLSTRCHRPSPPPPAAAAAAAAEEEPAPQQPGDGDDASGCAGVEPPVDAADLEDDDDDDNEVDEDSDGYAFLDADLGEPRDAAWEDASPESTLAVLFAAVAAGALLLIALRLAVVVLAVGLQGFKYGAVALVLVVAGLYLL